MAMTLDEVREALPTNLRSMATLGFAEEVAAIASNQEIGDAFKENFVSYAHIISGRKGWTLDHYLNAVKFISYKLLGHTDREAWIHTFPQRYKNFLAQGQTELDISRHTHSYKQNKLVMQLFEQTIIPSHILNQPLHQDAINILAEIMTNTKYSGMVRVKAAEALLQYTKPPETHKIKLEVTGEEMDAITELRKATEELAKTQLKALKKGLPLKEIAEQNIIEAEIEEVVSV
jgi:hypothetical protein